MKIKEIRPKTRVLDVFRAVILQLQLGCYGVLLALGPSVMKLAGSVQQNAAVQQHKGKALTDNQVAMLHDL